MGIREDTIIPESSDSSISTASMDRKPAAIPPKRPNVIVTTSQNTHSSTIGSGTLHPLRFDGNVPSFGIGTGYQMPSATSRTDPTNAHVMKNPVFYVGRFEIPAWNRFGNVIPGAVEKDTVVPGNLPQAPMLGGSSRRDFVLPVPLHEQPSIPLYIRKEIEVYKCKGVEYCGPLQQVRIIELDDMIE